MFFLFSKKSRELSDEELVREYQRTGKLHHAGELFQRYTALTMGLCLKYLKDGQEAEDTVMEIFEKITQDLKRHDVQNFRSWFYTLAKNHCLKKIRNLNRERDGKMEIEKSEAVFMEIGAFSDPLIKDQTEEQLKLLQKGIEQLAEEQRICIKLFYLEEKTYKEVAGETGFDIKKVKSYLQNGKRNLKLYLLKHRDE